ncbi:hypothetical protein N0B31_19990 [Salinirubellus salinus]|uniref:Uncharacterized protein n=1 Tax=Salinirubellus salinus TaxID=1364945 RepID=A0A9E7R2I8_9EURY|nr:hypothetical protein [Salinirubellus salinus]UWM54386.1 hypothetical protein N0B31_19990 [Salinirubellus salinus]
MTDHRYATPEKGSTDWHLPLNDNFTRLDTDVEIRDQATKRGNYEPKSGAKFLATDTGAVFVGDGNNWQYIGQLASGREVVSDDVSRIDVQSSAPSSPSEGDLWVDTS